MKLALFTSAIDGDNSGDAIIESAITRLIACDDIVRLQLKKPVSDEDIARANACDAAVICGTNLYQHVFACGLTAAAVEALRVPLIPFGIGASAPMGEIPIMDQAGVDAVRAIHRKCRVGSVRDEASYRFLKSIGVDNVELTGCPVLFHGLGCPDFNPSGEGYTLAPRARLLHIDPKWQRRQSETLDRLARRYRPKLVLQSPYDLEEAERLAERHKLELVYDPAWQASVYLDAAKEQRASLGFRLHFAMLSIAYGKPAFLVSHDSRADEFCKLVGLPAMRIDDYSDAFLDLKIAAMDFPADAVRRRWTELGQRTLAFLAANDLPARLEIDPRPLRPLRRKHLGRKPRVAVLIDTPNWAYDHSMRQIRKELAGEFDIDLKYRSRSPHLDPARYDLLHVCFWGEEYHKPFGFPRERIVKEVSSHRWQHESDWGPIPVEEFDRRWLSDSATAICTSLRLKDLVEPVTRARVLHTPNGVDVRRLPAGRVGRTGELVYGWAGNAKDPLKRYDDIVVPACRGRSLITASGEIPHARMPRFYSAVDVYLVTSTHEGEPLTLVEAMASGCFPVCSNVGIVPELVEHGQNGLIVEDDTVEGFRRAFAWCEANREKVREAGRANAARMARERSWGICAQFFARAYKEALADVLAPRFRNDDVAWDSSLPDLERFSAVFAKYHLRQVHGICLNGRNNACFRFGGDAVEYEGHPSISKLPNAEIRRLSQGMPIAERRDLVDWLNRCPDELALHGLYHTDYSAMSGEEQERDIGEGLCAMRELFPGKPVRYFIAPFNRTNADTYAVAGRHGLTVLAGDGVHLEEAIHKGSLSIEPAQWYRYHHHRFYEASAFDFYDLSLAGLDRALGNCFSTQPRALDLAVQAPRPYRPDTERLASAIKARLRRYPIFRRMRQLLAGEPTHSGTMP